MLGGIYRVIREEFSRKEHRAYEGFADPYRSQLTATTAELHDPTHIPFQASTEGGFHSNAS